MFLFSKCIVEVYLRKYIFEIDKITVNSMTSPFDPHKFNLITTRSQERGVLGYGVFLLKYFPLANI